MSKELQDLYFAAMGPHASPGESAGEIKMKYRVSRSGQSGEVEAVGTFDSLEAAIAACRAATDRDHDASVHLGEQLVFGANLTNDWKRRVSSAADGSSFLEEEIQARNEAGW